MFISNTVPNSNQHHGLPNTRLRVYNTKDLPKRGNNRAHSRNCICNGLILASYCKKRLLVLSKNILNCGLSDCS